MYPFVLPMALGLASLFGAWSAAAFSPAPGGCQLLRDRAAPVCRAKLSCSNSVAAITAVRPLFAQCAAGSPVQVTAVQNAINQFSNVLYFQCCIGNDLVQTLPGGRVRNE